jgi:hypothetical protein
LEFYLRQLLLGASTIATLITSCGNNAKYFEIWEYYLGTEVLKTFLENITKDIVGYEFI